MRIRSLISVLLVPVLASPLAADLITGRVVDANGVGVAGVNIDAINQATGNPVTLVNDGTDGSGFFTTTVPAGVYTFFFQPAPPPTTTLLIKQVSAVAVAGTKNMGTITLPTGVSLSARAKNQGGVPLSNVEIEVIDLATHLPILLQGGVTDAFGNVSIAVPTTPIEVRFLTAALAATLAPRAFELTLGANTNLGDITFFPGLVLQGTVRRSNGTPVVGADTDVLDSVTGDKLFTPSDNTDSAGVFSVVVPAGLYDVEACPGLGDQLVGNEIRGVVVGGPTNTGVITLQNGVVLSGTVLNYQSTPMVNADVDLRDALTGLSVVTCNDNTNASGAYSIIVPNGTFIVTFRPSGDCASGVGTQELAGVVVSGNTFLNGVLPNATASASVFVGDGVNVDVLTPIRAVIGSTWHAPLTIGHPHGSSGVITLFVRPTAFNGPSIRSQIGGRSIEFLLSGPLMASINGAHNGATGNIPPVLIPNDYSLVGQTWAAQYAVLGGGHVDLSRAVVGVVGCQ